MKIKRFAVSIIFGIPDRIREGMYINHELHIVKTYTKIEALTKVAQHVTQRYRYTQHEIIGAPIAVDLGKTILQDHYETAWKN